MWPGRRSMVRQAFVCGSGVLCGGVASSVRERSSCAVRLSMSIGVAGTTVDTLLVEPAVCKDIETHIHTWARGLGRSWPQGRADWAVCRVGGGGWWVVCGGGGFEPAGTSRGGGVDGGCLASAGWLWVQWMIARRVRVGDIGERLIGVSIVEKPCEWVLGHHATAMLALLGVVCRGQKLINDAPITTVQVVRRAEPTTMAQDFAQSCYWCRCCARPQSSVRLVTPRTKLRQKRGPHTS